MATETLNIRVREDGTRVVRRNLQRVGQTTSQLRVGVAELGRALTALAGAFGIQQATKFLDINRNIENRLRAAGHEGTQLLFIYKDLLKVSNETRSSFEATAEMYARLRISSRELGITSLQTLDFTRQLNQAIILSGASAREAEAGIIQLSQGMAAGRLQGDELRSVLEQLPVVGDTIAQGMKVTRGELRALGADGKITAQMIIDAFDMAKEDLEERFGRTIPTIGQNLTILKTSFIAFTKQFDDALGASDKFNTAIRFLASNLYMVGSALVAVGAATLVAFTPTHVANVKRLQVAIKGLYATMSAHPLVALLTVLTGVIVYLALMRDEINVGLDAITTLGDVFRAVAEDIAARTQWMGDVWREVVSFMDAVWEQIVYNWSLRELAAEFDAFFVNTGDGWFGFFRKVARILDGTSALIVATGAGIWAFFRKLPQMILETFVTVYNSVAGIIERIYNNLVTLMNLAASFTNKKFPLAPKLEIQRYARSGIYETIGEEIAQEIQRGLESGGAIEEWVIDIGKRAQEIGRERHRRGLLERPEEVQQPPIFPSGKGDRKALDDFLKRLNALLNMLNPIRAAQQAFSEGQQILGKALKMNLLTLEEYVDYSQRLFHHYRDALDPLGAYLRGLEKEEKLLRINVMQRELAREVLQAEEDLRDKGLILTYAQRVALEQETRAHREFVKTIELEDSVIIEATKNRGALRTETEAMFRVLARGDIELAEAQALVLDRLAGSGINIDAFETQLELQKDGIRGMYELIEELETQSVITSRDANNARLQFYLQTKAQEFQAAETFFGNLATLQNVNNAQIARIGKAAAMTQAIINTYVGATKALAEGGIAGPALMASVIAAGMAQVAQIAAQPVPAFAVGGSFTVPGALGGTDSQLVAFRASPGERVSVQTPTQVRKGSNASQSATVSDSDRTVNKIVNVIDPSLVGDFLTSSTGEQTIINVIRNNSATIRRAIES